jgi:histidinol dehydrogenase
MSSSRSATCTPPAPSFEAEFQRVLHWSAETDAAIEAARGAILADVRSAATPRCWSTPPASTAWQADSVAALELSPPTARPPSTICRRSVKRCRLRPACARYHQRQLDACGRSWSYRDADGTLLGQKVTPLDRVGIYVPGGKAAYPSSLLMNAVPAHVAGVGEIIMVVPTPVPGSVATGGSAGAGRGERNDLCWRRPRGRRHPCSPSAARRRWRRWPTARPPCRGRQDHRPGNAYVASAKKRVFGQVGIDMIAGPSEILVLADGSTPPDWVAMDLFSQAEHDELAQSILLCPDAAYIAQVQAAIDRLLPGMPRRDVIRASLEGRGALIHTRSMEEACAISNRIAPEHLEVSSADPHRWEPLLRHAGAIFLGAFTSESLGDYCAGPNHVLPTSRARRASRRRWACTTSKRSSLIEVSEAGAQVLGPIAADAGLRRRPAGPRAGG